MPSTASTPSRARGAERGAGTRNARLRARAVAARAAGSGAREHGNGPAVRCARGGVAAGRRIEPGRSPAPATPPAAVGAPLRRCQEVQWRPLLPHVEDLQARGRRRGGGGRSGPVVRPLRRRRAKLSVQLCRVSTADLLRQQHPTGPQDPSHLQQGKPAVPAQHHAGHAVGHRQSSTRRLEDSHGQRVETEGAVPRRCSVPIPRWPHYLAVAASATPAAPHRRCRDRAVARPSAPVRGPGHGRTTKRSAPQRALAARRSPNPTRPPAASARPTPRSRPSPGGR